MKPIEHEEDNVDTLSFREVENCFNESRLATSEDVTCEPHFQQPIIHLDSDAYSLSLPKAKESDVLANSYQRVLQLFKDSKASGKQNTVHSCYEQVNRPETHQHLILNAWWHYIVTETPN